MKILDLYIGRHFIKIFFVVMAIPGILFSFFELLSQLDAVGRGTYTTGDALLYVVLTLPGRLQELMPMTTLLGGIVALGMLADRSELLAMEASGISVFRISAPVMCVCLVLMLLSAVAGEVVVPGLEQEARALRFQALSGGGVTPVRHGFWARFHDSFIHVESIGDHGTAAGIDIFEFDPDCRMQAFVHAESARILENAWVMKDCTKKTIKGIEIDTEHIDAFTLEGFLNPEQVSSLELPPERLSTPDLIQYIEALKKSGQNAEHYSLALWRKLSLPLTTAAMALLSLGFVFGSTREMGAGLRITVGSFVGIALYLGEQLVTQIGTFLDLPSFVVAMAPAAAVAALAAVRLKRIV